MTAALLRAYYGTEEPLPEIRRLRAGDLTAELVDGNLRAIAFRGREVLRAVSFLVRDTSWGTYIPAIDDLVIEEGREAFEVRYRARCTAEDGSELTYEATILGRADGSVSFGAEATPTGDFVTNRCGFTVLHPILGLAGRPVEVEHVDGSVEHAVLPDLIEPAQPFKDMRAITHEVGPGIRATCRMEGDAFEMEDQRNWSDASYKTYVRPLALPWPYTLPAGVPLRQSVALRIEAREPKVRDGASKVPEPVRVTCDGAAGRFADFGLVLAPEQAQATLAHAGRLQELAPQTLLCHFDPTAGHGVEALRDFERIARLIDAETVLECVLPCVEPPAEELRRIARLVAEAGLRLDAVAVSPAVDRRSTPPGSIWPACPPLEEVYDAARAAFPGLIVGGGMFSYFTELNRKHPPVARLDFVTHCTCPIVHDADDRSVMQSLEALPFILRSARAIIGRDRPYRIGPSTIGMRHNPYGARTTPNPAGGRVTMAERDPRQHGLFAAAWMIGYAARLGEAGVAAFVGGALTGDFGLIDGDGTPRPVFHAARMLSSIAGWQRRSCRSSAEERVLALAAVGPEGGSTLLLANLTPEPQAVELPFGGWCTLLDETSLLPERRATLPAAMTGRLLRLLPYAVARIDQPE
ncbi:hypothetical protein [Ancylobacter oerskovii]|uniref:Uncharacterized protein n=1 Tax=Ancylobacter oerskovii TaxID=459519 RepID=A0ABW4YZ79_9HYPH|nr:hypothetical protein [Ancylobacter oerskovii]MBS7543852.1 hypothetical protein [Ancylobacter oerskovii]